MHVTPLVSAGRGRSQLLPVRERENTIGQPSKQSHFLLPSLGTRFYQKCELEPHEPSPLASQRVVDGPWKGTPTPLFSLSPQYKIKTDWERHRLRVRVVDVGLAVRRCMSTMFTALTVWVSSCDSFHSGFNFREGNQTMKRCLTFWTSF